MWDRFRGREESDWLLRSSRANEAAQLRATRLTYTVDMDMDQVVKAARISDKVSGDSGSNLQWLFTDLEYVGQKGFRL